MADIDTGRLKGRVDLIGLIGADVPLKRAASTKGGEWSGPCPFCGGRDRFRVWPLAEAPGWWCRSCGEQGDAIAYVAKRDGLGFVEACEALGAVVERAPRPPAPPLPPDESEPSEDWRSTALAFVEHCERALWSEAGAEGLAYLRDERGLKDEAIRRWRLGWNGEELRRDGARWGQSGQVRLPRGVVIPWFTAGELWAVKIRRRPDGEPKYWGIAGGKPGSVLYGLDTLAGHRAAILVETELDAVLVHQEAGDLVGVVAAGTAKKALGARALRYLLPLARLLVAYDNDAAGEDAAAELLGVSARLRRAKVPNGAKDPGEFHEQGGRLRDWAAFLVAREFPRPVARPPAEPSAAARLTAQLQGLIERLAGEIVAAEGRYNALPEGPERDALGLAGAAVIGQYEALTRLEWLARPGIWSASAVRAELLAILGSLDGFEWLLDARREAAV